MKRAITGSTHLVFGNPLDILVIRNGVCLGNKEQFAQLHELGLAEVKEVLAQDPELYDTIAGFVESTTDKNAALYVFPHQPDAIWLTNLIYCGRTGSGMVSFFDGENNYIENFYLTNVPVESYTGDVLGKTSEIVKLITKAVADNPRVKGRKLIIPEGLDFEDFGDAHTLGVSAVATIHLPNQYSHAGQVSNSLSGLMHKLAEICVNVENA